MNTKEELIENIKNWVSYDSEIKNLQKSIKEIREKKKELTKNLIDVMKNHEIDCFDINDGKLLYTKNKVKTPLNKNNLMIALEKYFENESVNGHNLSTLDIICLISLIMISYIAARPFGLSPMAWEKSIPKSSRLLPRLYATQPCAHNHSHEQRALLTLVGRG